MSRNEERLNALFKDWQVVGLVGEGAFGKVYKVKRETKYMDAAQEYAAIKVISIPEKDINLVKESCNEIASMIQLGSASNVVQVHDYKIVKKDNEEGYDIYIRMPFLTSFDKYCENHTLQESDVVKLAEDICSALQACSKKNIIHRDIKPANIFIDDYGKYALGDFGIAKIVNDYSSVSDFKGTPNYWAPEICEGKEFDARVDIYSLGIVLYRLMNNGKLPFLNPEANTVTSEQNKHALEKRMSGEALPNPVNASNEFAKVIIKACAFKPELRYRDAAEMKNALRKLPSKALNSTDQVSKPRIGESSLNDNLDKTMNVRSPKGNNVPEFKYGNGMACPPVFNKNSNSFGHVRSKYMPLVFLPIAVVAIVGGVLTAHGLREDSTNDKGFIVKTSEKDNGTTFDTLLKESSKSSDSKDDSNNKKMSDSIDTSDAEDSKETSSKKINESPKKSKTTQESEETQSAPAPNIAYNVVVPESKPASDSSNTKKEDDTSKKEDKKEDTTSDEDKIDTSSVVDEDTSKADEKAPENKEEDKALSFDDAKKDAFKVSSYDTLTTLDEFDYILEKNEPEKSAQNYKAFDELEVKDTKYKNGFTVTGDFDKDADDQKTVTLNLDEKYNIIVLTPVIAKGNNDASITFYTDGEKVVEYTISKDDVRTFEFDVKNVKKFEIVVDDGKEDSETGTYAFGDVKAVVNKDKKEETTEKKEETTSKTEEKKEETKDTSATENKTEDKTDTKDKESTSESKDQKTDAKDSDEKK